MTNVNWPEAVFGIIAAIGFYSWMIGQWPWEGIIKIHKHYHRHDPRKKNKVEEDGGDDFDE